MKRSWSYGDVLAEIDRLVQTCESSFEMLRTTREKIEKLGEETGYEVGAVQLQIKAMAATRPK